jgi:hypothetical protein
MVVPAATGNSREDTSGRETSANVCKQRSRKSGLDPSNFIGHAGREFIGRDEDLVGAINAIKR